jgi:hypothetical protein
LRQPAIGPHFILGQWRSAARRRLTLTLGHAMRTRRFPRFVAPAVAGPTRRQRLRSAPERHGAVRQSAFCRVFMQTQDSQRRPATARRPTRDHGATRGHHIGTPARASQFVVHASRGSAAPGSQRVVVRGAPSSGGSGAGRGARTIQQPTFCARRYSGLMAIHIIKRGSLREHGARPNPVFNRTPCGSPRLALISFWAKHGLPQGAG